MMLKCAGRAYDPRGLEATSKGECAVLCPACPQPGKNLPADFCDAEGNRPDMWWLYALFVAIDANFRLKRKKVSKASVDPSLSKSWAYFIEDSAYKAYLDQHLSAVQDKSTCSSHSAVNMADTKANQGLSAMGVGTVDCARHNMKLPTGVGDLQKGEKYVNMDYLFFSTLRHNSVNILKILYDIACQWNKHLWEHMAKFPPSIQFLQASKQVTFLVPKFHLPAHIEKCQTSFSFNFLPGVGRMDGEAPERGWANINPIASSTKEMGPGARRDILDDNFRHSNWKIANLRVSMLEKLEVAIPKRANHCAALEELKEGLAVDHTENLDKWKVQIIDWENDHTKPNSYEQKGSGTISLAAVWLELAKEDAQDLQLGHAVVLNEDCLASVLINTGLELEEQQRHLRSDKVSMGAHTTDNQGAKLTERSNTLQRRIDTWVKLQHLFLPALATQRAKDTCDVDAINPPERLKLMLPSQIGKLVACNEKLQRIEWKL
ncbi:hypothetical protein BDN67DRAFT_982204 [Paxillus ammoniavirescens]|nr:hypothetical protein BDN67DRAFT_982204 [Paxillus ammoniavirescens]